jgi:hypothetical protein
MQSGLTTGWIIGICLTSVMAVIGWTVTISQALRMRVLVKLENNQCAVAAGVAALNIRTSVLENKYDTIQSALADIKALITHMRKE